MQKEEKKPSKRGIWIAIAFLIFLGLLKLAVISQNHSDIPLVSDEDISIPIIQNATHNNDTTFLDIQTSLDSSFKIIENISAYFPFFVILPLFFIIFQFFSDLRGHNDY